MLQTRCRTYWSLLCADTDICLGFKDGTYKNRPHVKHLEKPPLLQKPIRYIRAQQMCITKRIPKLSKFGKYAHGRIFWCLSYNAPTICECLSCYFGKSDNLILPRLGQNFAGRFKRVLSERCLKRGVQVPAKRFPM